MTSTAERYRTYQGPALFSMGFRPFFLLAALWAAIAVPIWVAAFSGWLPAEHFNRDWHAHEMVFGYLSGVIAGFLLTAVPNWTGRLPVTGAPLMGRLERAYQGTLFLTFGGGVNEVQRDLIALFGLGMPRVARR